MGRGGLEAGAAGERHDQVGHLDGGLARFGKSYVGEPDAIAEELSQDAAVRDADTILLTVPNQLGVAYNAHLLETVAKRIAPAIGWSAMRPYDLGEMALAPSGERPGFFMDDFAVACPRGPYLAQAVRDGVQRRGVRERRRWLASFQIFALAQWATVTPADPSWDVSTRS